MAVRLCRRGLSARALAQIILGLVLALVLALAVALPANADGATWTQIGLPNGATSGVIRAFAIEPTRPATLIVAADKGIFRSGDRGKTWTRTASFNPMGTLQRVVEFDPLDQRVVYAAVDIQEGAWQQDPGPEHPPRRTRA